MKTFLNILCVCITFIVSAAESQSLFDFRLETSPAIDKEVSTEIGESMITRKRVYVLPISMTLDEGIEVHGSYMFVPYVLKIAAGTLKFDNSEKPPHRCFWPDTNVILQFSTERGPRESVRAGICIKHGSQMDAPQYYAFWYLPTGNNTTDSITTQFSSKITTGEASAPTAFKRELIYSGIFQNILAIQYREFVNDMARPAFQQELKYDLTRGDIIGYKGARFQILGSDNIAVRYKVLKHLDDPTP